MTFNLHLLAAKLGVGNLQPTLTFFIAFLRLIHNKLVVVQHNKLVLVQ